MAYSKYLKVPKTIKEVHGGFIDSDCSDIVWILFYNAKYFVP